MKMECISLNVLQFQVVSVKVKQKKKHSIILKMPLKNVWKFVQKKECHSLLQHIRLRLWSDASSPRSSSSRGN